jgi:hypothetical protein
MVTAGAHTVYAESADHSYASFARDLVAGSVSKVDLTLFPQRSIAGTVRFGGSADSIPVDASLEGIRIVLEPSGESATTDVNGHFAFARAPYDPASTILLDPASVPNGYDSSGTLPLADGATEVTLAPKVKLERVSFH